MAKVQSKSSWSLTKTAPGGKQNVTAAYPKSKLEFNFFFRALIRCYNFLFDSITQTDDQIRCRKVFILHVKISQSTDFKVTVLGIFLTCL